jgi:hypothetical protein
MTDEEPIEGLRDQIVDLSNEVKSVTGTVHTCAAKFGSVGWDEGAANGDAERALAAVESEDAQILREHKNTLREILKSAADVLSLYQVTTDKMPGRGGMNGIFIRSGINRVNITLERTERES